MATSTENKDFLGMSDEDFLKAPAPQTEAVEPAAPVQQEEPVVEKAAPAVSEQVEVKEDDTDVASKTAVDTDDGDGAEDSADKSEAGAADKQVEEKSGEDLAAKKDEKTQGTSVPGSADATKTEDAKVKDKKNGKPGEKQAQAVGEPEAKPVDFESFYKQIMAPFKANGKEFKLNTPEEAIRMMQMGAGYGRKLQELQPALKTLRMLEKADLLDEGKLSFLIDINNKNPEAIKKLIADSGIDPLELNIGDNVQYTPKNHAVSDKEMAFQTAVQDVQSAPGGKDTIAVVNQTWDQESKSALWDQPQILNVIQAQRENGIYDQITTEMERQKTLGLIPHNTPFLQAYQIVGDSLFPKPKIQTQSGTTPQTQVIETRTATPKAQVENGKKAAAAASTKTTPSRSSSTVANPLGMADEDFLKQFQGRL